jgi:hypothetical protein
MKYKEELVMIPQPCTVYIHPIDSSSSSSCVKLQDLSLFSLYSVSSDYDRASEIYSTPIERHGQVWMSLHAYLLELSFVGPGVIKRNRHSLLNEVIHKDGNHLNNCRNNLQYTHNHVSLFACRMYWHQNRKKKKDHHHHQDRRVQTIEWHIHTTPVPTHISCGVTK